MFHHLTGLSALILSLCLFSSCQYIGLNSSNREHSDTKPGLHSLMHEVAVRHNKLWFAGISENWKLANYEAHELEELVELIEKFHPEYDGIPVAKLLRSMLLTPLERLEESIERKSRQEFEKSYDELTASCNHCHVASDREFIVIQRPSAPVLTNIRFEAPQP